MRGSAVSLAAAIVGTELAAIAGGEYDIDVLQHGDGDQQVEKIKWVLSVASERIFRSAIIIPQGFTRSMVQGTFPIRQIAMSNSICRNAASARLRKVEMFEIFATGASGISNNFTLGAT